ncbi:MAG: 5'-nucleosidase [Micavibrio sp.]|nr:MAG: 5'-nucleosidase [Micavibrio sp.]
MKDALLVFAMEQESQDVFDNYDVLHTGIGKVNAAYTLTRVLQKKRPKLVVNMGTAGSRKHKPGSIVNCTSFVQRDMDVTILGFEKFQTPFSKTPLRLEYGVSSVGFPQGICGTGDNFDASEDSSAFDVVDMEGYALADICQREAIPFLCLKYISDGADGDAKKDWNESLHETAEKLKEALEKVKL